MTTTTLTEMSVTELGRRIYAKEVSPTEATEAFLARIEALEPKLNAFITVMGDQALAAAKEAEREIGRGAYRGPLHGIPVALKDLFWTKGVRTTSGSAVTKDFVPQDDATAVTRLRDAGAFVIGKTNMVEYAYGGTEHHDLYGAPRNPWGLEHITGGSSSGSATAVASGEAPIALGTDTAGSVRGPAALCGLTGLKPTYGLVSRYGVTPLSYSQDHVGPLARSAEDVAIAMNVLAGYDPRDSGSGHRPSEDYMRALGRGVSRLRVGVLKESVWGKVHPEVEHAFQSALTTLGEMGARVDEVSMPELEYVSIAQTVITQAEATSYHADHIHRQPELYHPGVRARLEVGMFLPATAYVQAQRVRMMAAKRFAEVFRQVDLIATPTTPMPAPRFGEASVKTANGEISARELVRITRLFNPNGLPAISLPCGFSKEGLPIGLQLVGKPFDDALVIGAAHGYQQATSWHTRRPAV